MSARRSSVSAPYRAALLAALLVACSDGAGTLPSDPGAYSPLGSAGSRSASGGSAQFASGSSGGQAPSASGGGGGNPGAAGTQGITSAPLPGVGGSGAGAGNFGTGATGGVANGTGGSFGSGAFGGASAAGRAGAAFGGAGSSLAGHAGAVTQGAAGKQGAAGAPANVPATFAAVSSIIQANCAICHGSRMPRLTNSANLYKTLTSTTVKECGGNALVKPNDPANSALLMLPNWECDDLVMPQGCVDMPCLTDTELATITAWINAGAPSK